jgi:hypothetical protein
VQAIESNQQAPLSHKYSHSVIAAYNCAKFFLAVIRSLYAQFAALERRGFFLYVHVFSCAVSCAHLLHAFV